MYRTIPMAGLGLPALFEVPTIAAVRRGNAGQYCAANLVKAGLNCRF